MSMPIARRAAAFGLVLALLGLPAPRLWAQDAAPHLVGAAGDVNYRVGGTLVAPAAALAAGEVDLLFDYADAKNTYVLRLKGEQAQFLRLKDGHAETLGMGGTLRRGAAGDKLPFSLQRRDWEMLFLCNGVVCARAEDRVLPSGKVGWSASGAGLGVEGMTPPQPVEELFFSDDFMRGDDSLGGWKLVQGKWGITQQGSRASRSAKAFTFHSQGGGPCLAVHGNVWDCDYSAQCAVRCDNNGAVGLVVGYQDERDYYRLRWTAAGAEDGGTFRLQRVLDGQVTDLMPPIPGGFQPRVWYKLQLSMSGGWVYGWLDDTPMFEVATSTFGEGKLGLCSEPGKGEEPDSAGAVFDAVVERGFPLLVDDFTRPASGRWTAVGGDWQPRYGAVLPTGGGFVAAPASGLYAVGADDWQNATFEADVSYTGGSVGLVTCRQANGDLYAAGVSPQGCILARLDHGVAKPLAGTQKGVPTGDWHRVSLAAEDGLLRLSVDGEERLEAFDDALPQGGCGLFTDKAQGARFTNVRARFRPDSYSLPPMLPAEFVSDRYMASWASPGAAWIQVEGQPSRWHKGFFYGDRRVHFTIPGLGKQQGKVTLALGAADTTAVSGYQLVIALTKDKKDIGLTLRDGDKVLDQVTVPGEGDAPEVAFELRGRFVLVEVGGKTVLHHALPEEKP
jgi:hypothetical protein